MARADDVLRVISRQGQVVAFQEKNRLRPDVLQRLQNGGLPAAVPPAPGSDPGWLWNGLPPSASD